MLWDKDWYAKQTMENVTHARDLLSIYIYANAQSFRDSLLNQGQVSQETGCGLLCLRLLNGALHKCFHR